MLCSNADVFIKNWMKGRKPVPQQSILKESTSVRFMYFHPNIWSKLHFLLKFFTNKINTTFLLLSFSRSPPMHAQAYNQGFHKLDFESNYGSTDYPLGLSDMKNMLKVLFRYAENSNWKGKFLTLKKKRILLNTNHVFTICISYRTIYAVHIILSIISTKADNHHFIISSSFLHGLWAFLKKNSYRFLQSTGKHMSQNYYVRYMQKIFVMQLITFEATCVGAVWTDHDQIYQKRKKKKKSFLNTCSEQVQKIIITNRKLNFNCVII